MEHEDQTPSGSKVDEGDPVSGKILFCESIRNSIRVVLRYQHPSMALQHQQDLHVIRYLKRF